MSEFCFKRNYDEEEGILYQEISNDYLSAKITANFDCNDVVTTKFFTLFYKDHNNAKILISRLDVSGDILMGVIGTFKTILEKIKEELENASLDMMHALSMCISIELEDLLKRIREM